MPAGMELVWAWFVELSARRSYTFNGPQPITWPDMAAWSAMTDSKPTPGDLRAITALDDLYMATSAKWRKRR